MRLEIIPRIGVGALRFGMSRTMVRKVMNSPFRTFNKYGQQRLSEQFLGRGIITYYDNNDIFEYVDISAPSQPILNGVDIFSLNLAQVRSWFQSIGGAMIDEIDGPTSKALGLSVWAPEGQDDIFAPLEAIGAFGPGYFEKYAKQLESEASL